MRAFRIAALLLTLASPWGEAVSGQEVNTTVGGVDAWVGGVLGVGGGEGYWGDPDPGYAGFGQLFTAPGGAPVLDAFTFFLADFAIPILSPDLFWYRAFLGTWDGSAVTSVLWQSGDNPSLTSPGVYYSWEPLAAYRPTSFSPGVSLSPGATYLAFLYPTLRNGLIAGAYDLDAVAMRERESSPSGVADGQGGAVLISSLGLGDPVPAPTEWLPYANYDAAFVATFSNTSVVPEPSTWVLLATGLLALGAAGRSRRWGREEL